MFGQGFHGFSPGFVIFLQLPQFRGGFFLQNIMAIFMGHTSNTISWGYGCAMVACIDIYTSTYNWNCTLHFLQTLGLDADGPKPLDPQVKRPYWLHPPAPAARYFN